MSTTASDTAVSPALAVDTVNSSSAEPTITHLNMHQIGAKMSELSTPHLPDFSEGRAPWWDSAGNTGRPFIIGVTGGTASGKSTVCQAIVEHLNLPWVIQLSMDRFYKPLSDAQIADAHTGNYNFDHPDAFDFDEFQTVLRQMRTGDAAEVPVYSFEKHARESHTDTLYGADVVIVEGILVLYDKRVRDQFDMCVFVETDADLRLARRIKRDVAERGRSVDGVLEQYIKTVKPSFDDFIAPTKRYADLIIPRGGENVIAINLMVEHIRTQLKSRGVMFSLPPADMHIAENERVSVLEQTTSLLALVAQINDATTPADLFSSCVHKLCLSALRSAIDDAKFNGTLLSSAPGQAHGGPCGVAVIRGGEVMTQALKELQPDAHCGHIVIGQAEDKSKGARLHYCEFPTCLTETAVLLLVNTLATGNAVSMAIHVLLNHKVAEQNITIVCLMASYRGLSAIASQFPRVRVTCATLTSLNDKLYMATPALSAFSQAATTSPSAAAAAASSDHIE